MEKISIIIPAYNAAATLERTVQSCWKQTLLPDEIIIVDDGSQDETIPIARSLQGNINLLSLDNGGVSRARNHGATMAHGEWFVFLDADDQLLPHALESLLSVALKKKAGVAYGMVIERREPPLLPRLNGFSYAAGSPPHGAERNFWRNAIITPGSAIVRATLHQLIGGFVTGYEPMEDRDYWIKAGLLEEMAFCDTVLLDKYWLPSSHGSQHHKRIYRGQKAQRALRHWAEERHLPTNWMPTDAAIIKSALQEALWRRQYDILKPLLRDAEALHVSHWKAWLTSLLFPQKDPEWIARS